MQTLAVVQNANTSQQIEALISNCNFFGRVDRLHLQENLRLLRTPEAQGYVETILKFGRGTVTHMDPDERQEGAPVDTVRIQDPLLLNSFTKDPVGDLIAFVYGTIRDKYKDPDYFRDCGIVTPLNVDVNLINDKVVTLLPEQPFEFNAVNKLDEEENANIWSPELLQSLEVPGLPQSVLRLTAYAVVMLMRNMSLRDGLVNGTRMQVLPGLGHNTQNVIKCRILTGSRAGSVVFIPRIVFEPTTVHLPFKFRRRQYPLRLCFGMTINKSQGQGFHRLGVYLPSPVFSHGQLYVALSRLIDPLGLKILIIPGVCQGRMSRTNPSYAYTRNVVLKAVFTALERGWISYTRSYIDPCSFMMHSAPFDDVCLDTKTVEVRLHKSVKYVEPNDVLTFGCGAKRVQVRVLSRKNYPVHDPNQAETVLRTLLANEGLNKVLPKVPNINHAIGAYIQDSNHGYQNGYKGVYKPDTVVKYNGFTALRIARIVNGAVLPSVVPPPPTTDSQILTVTIPAVVHNHSAPRRPVPIPAPSTPLSTSVTGPTTSPSASSSSSSSSSSSTLSSSTTPTGPPISTSSRSSVRRNKRKIIELSSDESEDTNIEIDPATEQAIRASAEQSLIDTLERGTPLRDLSATEREEYIAFMRRHYSTDVIVSRFKSPITVTDLKSIRPGAWLNDAIINMALRLIEERSSCVRAPLKVIVYHIGFIPKYRDQQYHSVKNYGNTKVRNWNARTASTNRMRSIFDFDLLFVPVNIDVRS